jgi:uncharacterized protein (TIGR03437 family)
MEMTKSTVLGIALAGLLTVAVHAQFVQQGGKLAGSDAMLPSYQGTGVALSTDGNTALVGGYKDANNLGAAWLFTRTGGVWTQQGAKLTGIGSLGTTYQGIRVALSGDGNTAILGGDADNQASGAAWVFARSGGTWIQQGGKLVALDSVGNAYQGFSVALSADGNTALVGGYTDNNFTGAVWIYTRSAGVWRQQAKLTGTGIVGTYAGQGFSAALSADGNTALAGGLYDDDYSGAAWVFTRDSSGRWTQQGNKLIGSGATGKAQQGWSVALSGDGNTALVHGAADSNWIGATWVFTRSGGVWTQQGPKLVGTGMTGQAQQVDQGNAVALSSDGNIAVLGRSNDGNGTGAVWVFARSGGAWTQLGDKLTGTGAHGNSLQGYTVALSGDGGTLIEGGPADNGEVGGAWVFAATPVRIVSVNVAGGGADVAQNTWIEIHGAGLATAGIGAGGITWSDAPEFASGRMPTALQGVSVKVNGKSAYVYFVSPGQVNVLTPLDATTGQVQVQVTVGANASAPFTVNLKPVAPAFLLFGAGPHIAAVHADGSLVAPAPMSVPGYTFTPAKPGETILLFGDGFGLPSSILTDGSAAQAGALPAMPQVTIGGAGAVVAYAGVISPGLYQFNVMIPASAADGNNPVGCTYAGASTPAGAVIAVQH